MATNCNDNDSHSSSHYSGQFSERRKGAMRLTIYVKHQPTIKGQSTAVGTTCPTSLMLSKTDQLFPSNLLTVTDMV